MASPLEKYRGAGAKPPGSETASGASPFEQFRTQREPAAPAAPKPTVSDIAEISGKGFAKGFVQTPGLPGDLVQLIDLAGQYVGEQTGVPTVPAKLATAAMGIPELPTGEDILELVRKVPVLRDLVSPEQVVERFPDSQSARFAETMGEFAGGSAVPISKTKMVPEILLGAVSGAGAQTAEEMGQNELVGALAAPLALQGGAAGVRGLKRGVEGQLGAMQSTTERKAAQEILDSMTDRTEGRIRLKEGIAETEDIPGYIGDPAQMAGDPGLQALRGRVAKEISQPFVQQREQNVGAIKEALEGVAPQSDFGSLNTVRQSVETQLDGLSRNVDEALSAFGDQIDEIFLNTSAREQFDNLLGDYRKQVNDLKSRIPKQDTELPTEEIGRTAARQVEEAADLDVLETAGSMPEKSAQWAQKFDLFSEDVISELPIDKLERMRQLINDEIRTVSRGTVTGTDTTRLQRLDELRNSIDTTIDQAAEASQTVRNFRDFYRDEYVPRFRQGVGRQMTEAGTDQQPRIAGEDTLNKFLHSGAKGKQDAAQFKTIFGDEAESMVRSKLRNEIGDTVTREGVVRLQDKYKGVLSEFPGVKADLDKLAQGTIAFDDFARQSPDVLGRKRASGVEAVTDTNLPEDSVQADFAFWNKPVGKRTQIAKDLASKMNTPEEQESLRRSFYNWMRQSTEGKGKTAAGETTVRGDNLLATVNANIDTMRALGYTDQQLQRIRQIAKAADLESRVKGPAGRMQAELPGELGSSNKLGQLWDSVKDSIANTAYTVGKGFVGSGYALTFGGRDVLSKVRDRLQSEARAAILQEAFTNPKYMDELLTSGRAPQLEQKAAQEVERRLRYLIPTLQQEAGAQSVESSE